KTEKYSKFKEKYEEFKNIMETRKSAKEIGIFIITDNINIEILKNIILTKQKIIICQFNKLEKYIEQIEKKHN
ncbi:5390_t:CDS:1, partial [Gigaspora margarita]